MAYTPMRYDFQPIVQGTDWIRNIVFSTSGVADTLTNYTATFIIRDEPHSGGNSILSLTATPTANGSSTTVTGATGTVTVTITDVDLDAFVLDKYYYQLKLTSPTSAFLEYVPLYGIITVIRNL
jgi:hypothetical protein